MKMKSFRKSFLSRLPSSDFGIHRISGSRLLPCTEKGGATAGGGSQTGPLLFSRVPAMTWIVTP